MPMTARSTPHLDDTSKRIVEHLVPGRMSGTRAPNRKELAATSVLALDLTEASVKMRAEGVRDEDEDMTLPHWAGVIPLRAVAPEVPVPPSEEADRDRPVMERREDDVVILEEAP